MFLLRNIKSLVLTETNPQKKVLGSQMKQLNSIENAWILLENDTIHSFGSMENCPQHIDNQLDATGRLVLPSFCDSHTHLVFAATRENEFEDRINGTTYEEIAKKGGGILHSARRLEEMSEENLFQQAQKRLSEVIGFGTAALEIKSGYGLTVASELKMLRVIRRLRESAGISIKSTFLGAHAVPTLFKADRNAYISLIINEMLPNIAAEGLADYIDVFCEKIGFSVTEMNQLLEAGAKYNLKAKVHVNQFNCMGGIAAALRHKAISVDHLEVLDDDDLAALRSSDTIATLLPSAPFFLNDHYPPARKLLDANVAVALATDYNPGTSPSGRMSFVWSLACLHLKMTPSEALHALTLNGAAAMELSDTHGSIAVGKKANLLLTKPLQSLAALPYSFGNDCFEKIILNGKII